MDELKEQTLGWIEFPLAVQTAVASVLAGVGLELPYWFAQFAVLVVAGAFSTMLARAAWSGESGAVRFTAAAAAIGLGLIVAGVLFSWGRQLLHPPSGQVWGALAGEADRGWTVRLEDRGRGEMGVASLDWAGRTFALNFAPALGRIPYALAAEADGCELIRKRLSLAQSDGEASIDMDLRCRPSASR